MFKLVILFSGIYELDYQNYVKKSTDTYTNESVI